MTQTVQSIVWSSDPEHTWTYVEGQRMRGPLTGPERCVREKGHDYRSVGPWWLTKHVKWVTTDVYESPERSQ